MGCDQFQMVFFLSELGSDVLYVTVKKRLGSISMCFVGGLFIVLTDTPTPPPTGPSLHNQWLAMVYMYMYVGLLTLSYIYLIGHQGSLLDP